MQPTLSVLLIEDDKNLSRSLIDHLELERVICDYAANGNEGLTLLSKGQYEVIILDINMPGLDGLSFCRKIRGNGNDTPVLMLTARDTLDNKVEGFNAGADDYLVKPFQIQELIVRLHALSKRRSGQISILEVGPISLNLKDRAARFNGQPGKLTPIAFRLLELLLRASPDPVSNTDLLLKIWGDEIPDSNKLRVHMSNLRKALRSGDVDHLLKTIPGYGFYIAE